MLLLKPSGVVLLVPEHMRWSNFIWFRSALNEKVPFNPEHIRWSSTICSEAFSIKQFYKFRKTDFGKVFPFWMFGNSNKKVRFIKTEFHKIQWGKFWHDFLYKNIFHSLMHIIWISFIKVTERTAKKSYSNQNSQKLWFRLFHFLYLIFLK